MEILYDFLILSVLSLVLGFGAVLVLKILEFYDPC